MHLPHDFKWPKSGEAAAAGRAGTSSDIFDFLTPCVFAISFDYRVRPCALTINYILAVFGQIVLAPGAVNIINNSLPLARNGYPPHNSIGFGLAPRSLIILLHWARGRCTPSHIDAFTYGDDADHSTPDADLSRYPAPDGTSLLRSTELIYIRLSVAPSGTLSQSQLVAAPSLSGAISPVTTSLASVRFLALLIFCPGRLSGAVGDIPPLHLGQMLTCIQQITYQYPLCGRRFVVLRLRRSTIKEPVKGNTNLRPERVGGRRCCQCGHEICAACPSVAQSPPVGGSHHDDDDDDDSRGGSDAPPRFTAQEKGKWREGEEQPAASVASSELVAEPGSPSHHRAVVERETFDYIRLPTTMAELVAGGGVTMVHSATSSRSSSPSPLAPAPVPSPAVEPGRVSPTVSVAGSRAGRRPNQSLPSSPLLLPSPALPPQADVHGDEHSNEGRASPALPQLVPPFPPPGTPNWSDLFDMESFGPSGGGSTGGRIGSGWPVEEGEAEEVTESIYSETASRALGGGSGHHHHPLTNGVNGHAEDHDRYYHPASDGEDNDNDNEEDDSSSSSSWGLLGQWRYDEAIAASVGLSVPPRRRQRQRQGEAGPSNSQQPWHGQANGVNGHHWSDSSNSNHEAEAQEEEGGADDDDDEDPESEDGAAFWNALIEQEAETQALLAAENQTSASSSGYDGAQNGVVEEED
ncbi:hypothetical protein V8F20_001887 [Naviculisporaceae sp. PSN 640]